MTTIIENRRNLHQIPEIELTTQKTAQYIENVLDLYDCIIDHPIQNSVTAYFDNQKENTIVFRSDMDALPMEENTDLEFKSTNGCMHACGHDGHMAMVLELAKYAKESDYNVLLLFQPGEEKPGGAKPIPSGATTNFPSILSLIIFIYLHLSHYNFIIAPNLHADIQAPHLTHFSGSIKCFSLMFPSIALTAQTLVQAVQPLQASVIT